MQPFLFLNILCICFLGFATSYTDLKKGLIENRLVFPAIAVAFGLNFLNGFDFVQFLTNGFLAFLFGFLLWIASLWSAGDAKLFLAFALLFPLPFYGLQSFFPAFSILVNSFVPAFLFMFLIVFFKTNSRQKLQALKHAFSPGLVLSVAVFLFSFYWLLDLIIPFLPIQLDFFTMAILLFVFISCVEFLLPKKSIYVFAAIALAFFFLRINQVLAPAFLLFFFSFLLSALLLLFFVLRLGFSCFGKATAVSQLKPGMVLLELPVQRKGRIEKKSPLLPSFVNIFLEIKEKPFVETGPKGLSQSDIARLKRAKARGKLSFNSLLVQETLPFAPIIFAGTLLTFFTAFLFTF